MNRAEVLRWTDGLRDALRTHVKLSRAAAREDGCMLSMVVNGIRCAGLFAAVRTSKETVECLVRLLANMNVHEDEVFILVHTASEQMFVVHRRRLLERLERNPCVAYCAINATEQDVLTLKMDSPAYLRSTLNELLRAVSSTQEKQKCGRGALLLCIPNGALTGIALAGWLLEYTLIYFYESASALVPEARWYTAQSSWDIEEDGQDAAILKNNLAHQPLLVLGVDLWTGVDEHDPIIQFSIPKRLLSTLVESLNLSGSGVTAVVDSLTQYFHVRSPNATRIEVQWHERTMDRVAL